MQLRLIAAALPATLAGCGAAEDPSVFALPVAEAFQRLAHNELDALRLGRQCGILIHIRPQGDQRRHAVTWRVYSSGREMVRFTAALTAVDSARTRVAVEVQRGRDGREAYGGDVFYPRPAFNQPLRPAIEEQVAALLEGRDYDPARVPRGTDSVCNVQRAGLENGHRFSIHDEPGTDSRTSENIRRARDRDWLKPRP